MDIRHRGTALALLACAIVLFLAGCNSAQQAAPSVSTAKFGSFIESSETQHVAEEALGKDAEILARGDLAKNGSEQLLVVNRAGGTVSSSGEKSKSPFTILSTRAAILENTGGKWTEVLLCDEHLKNPNGYLGGSPVARETGWRLEYRNDPKQGLEMKFTPADAVMDESTGKTVFVRWNAEAKRYQSLDSSHERFLSESPTLEIPESVLKR